ncbi:MAG: hypothetical protein AB4372_04930 [Xenococcus sp. (in: cyanobacteria)]
MVFSLLKSLFQRSNKKAQDLGSQRSLSLISASWERDYDLEINEYPVRNPQIAQKLIEMKQYCYEVKESLRIAKEDTFASSDGDDIGFTIAETTDDNETPVNPEIFKIADQVIRRKQSLDEYVIGGIKLKKALENCLIYGDSFLSIQIDLQSKEIIRSLFLPTWEMFRKEDDQGYLEGFDQRRYLSNNQADCVSFYPFQVIHFRLDRGFLYGNSLWNSSKNNWKHYQESLKNIARACKDLSINPVVHSLNSSQWTQQQIDRYKAGYESQRREGEIITDLYEYSGLELRRLGGSNSSLREMIEAHLQWRYYFVPSGFPLWRYSGLQFQSGAKEISREPSRAYSRMRYGWCQLLTKGIKQVIDTEIILKKGYEFYEREVLNGKSYRVIWPEWSIDGMNDNDESNQDNINDLDLENNENEDTMNRYQLLTNGNGKIHT